MARRLPRRRLAFPAELRRKHQIPHLASQLTTAGRYGSSVCCSGADLLFLGSTGGSEASEVEEVILQGLCTFILGLCLLFNDDTVEKSNRYVAILTSSP